MSPPSLLDGDPDNPDLADLRAAAGLNLRAMAERVGMATMSYHRLERRGASQRGVPNAIIDAIASTLAIAPEQVRELLPRRAT